MKNLADRFTKCMDHYGYTQEYVAKKAGVTQQSIQQIRSGETKRPRHIKKYADLFKVEISWLMFGSGKPPLWASLEEGHIPDGNIPILEWNEIEEWIKNGAKNLDMQKEEREFIASPLPGQPERNKMFAVKVKNDAMFSFIPGSLSFTMDSILTAEPMPMGQSGDYLIIRRKNEKEPFFRQIIKEGDSLYLKPLNPQYKTININENIVILAVIISKTDVLI